MKKSILYVIGALSIPFIVFSAGLGGGGITDPGPDPGDVSKVGTPVNNEIGVWTGDGTLEGDTNLQWDGSSLDITGDITATGTTTLATSLTGVLRGDSGVVSTDTDVTDLVTAATSSAQGKVELAIASEINTGTDTDRAVTPDALAGSNVGRGKFGLVLVASDTAVTTGNGTEGIPVTAEFNGMNVVDVQCNVYTKGITGTTDVQLRRQRGAADADVLTTAVTLGDEYFAADETVNTSNDDLATGDMLFFDIDAIHSGTAPNGLSCIAIAELP